METITVLYGPTTGWKRPGGNLSDTEREKIRSRSTTGTNKSHRGRRSSRPQHRARGLRRGGYGWITLMRDLGGGVGDVSVLFYRILPLWVRAHPLLTPASIIIQISAPLTKGTREKRCSPPLIRVWMSCSHSSSVLINRSGFPPE
jgi:hypothetical protein